MLQPPCHACFVRELTMQMGHVLMFLQQELDRNFAVKFHVAGLKNDSHSATSDFFFRNDELLATRRISWRPACLNRGEGIGTISILIFATES